MSDYILKKSQSLNQIIKALEAMPSSTALDNIQAGVLVEILKAIKKEIKNSKAKQ